MAAVFGIVSHIWATKEESSKATSEHRRQECGPEALPCPSRANDNPSVSDAKFRDSPWQQAGHRTNEQPSHGVEGRLLPAPLSSYLSLASI